MEARQETKSHIPVPASVEQAKLLLLRWNTIQSRGLVAGHHTEFKELNKVLASVSAQQKDYEERARQLAKQRISSGDKTDIDLTRIQTQAFKLLSRNVDIPAEMHDALRRSLNKSTLNGKSNGVHKAVRVVGDELLQVRERRANIQDYTANKSDSSTGGVAETIIRNRLTHRLVELECLPANIGGFTVGDIQAIGSDELRSEVDELKIKALVELKALRLLTKQKSLRQQIVVQVSNNEDLKNIRNRTQFRLQKVHSAQELRLTEDLERKQRSKRELKEYERKMKKVGRYVRHSERMLDHIRTQTNRQKSMGKFVIGYHRETEREESRRSERTAKQRLQALRSNDEEAYIKLLDQTKDTRITHLLSQTNSFLKTLSAAVKVQQQDAGVDVQEEEIDEDKDYYQVAHRVKETITKQASILVGGSLKEYQVKGLEWMVSLYNNNLNGILADEMGLGKTIQSISLITYLIESKKQPGPYIVIVPLSTLTNWTLEFEKWAPSVKKVVYKGPPNARKAQQGIIRSGDFQVLLTTYEYIIKDKALLGKIKWVHMIIDEGHRMKNTQSKLSFTLTQFYTSRHRLILTGTPLQNNLPELWALLNFVLPKIFNSVKTFDEWFNTPFANTGGQDKMELNEEETLLIIRRLHKVLRPFLLRRLKKDVEKDLPDKVEKVIKCKMSALQAKLYDQMLRYNLLFVGSQTTAGKNSSVKGLNNKIMQLRKICNHPYVFEEVENMVNPLKVNNDDLWRTAGKFEMLDRILPKFKATGHRVLMFFQMTQVMDIMEDYLRLMGHQYLRLDGSTKADERSEMLKEFNAPDSPYFAFLLSTRAGGLGLNLQTADTVIIYDSDWNPHQDLQAQDRAHRIGQTKEVRILRLVTENSVEENILERAHAKLEIDGKVIQAGKFDNKSTNEEQEAFLRSLLDSEESKGTAQDDDDDMDDDELNDILARNDNELEVFQRIDQDAAEHGLYGKGKEKDRLFTAEELPSVYSQDIEEHIVPDKDEVLGRGARERKSIMYDDGLTEEQWLDAVDDDEDTIEQAIERKKARSAKRASKLAENLDDDELADADDIPLTTVRQTKEPTPVADALSVDDESVSAPPSTAGKRKRGRQSAKFNGVVEAEEEEGDQPPMKKKGRKSKAPDVLTPSEREALHTRAGALLDAFTSVTEEETGRSRSELFLELPSKKFYPDYYQLISNPISLAQIRKKLKSNEYQSINSVKADFDLMKSNAQQYNEAGSMVYEDAEILGAVLESTLSATEPKAAEETPVKVKKSGPKIRIKFNNSH